MPEGKREGFSSTVTLAEWIAPGMPLWVGLGLVAASFFTSALTAAFGLGGGVTLLALMSFALPVAVLIPLHGVVQFASNAGRLGVQRRAVRWDKAMPFILGGLIGAAIGALTVVTLPEAVLRLLLGSFIMMTIVLKLPALGRLKDWQYALAGAVTTFLSMFVGASGPLNAVLFTRAFSERKQVVATMAAVNASQHALKVAAFLVAGVVLGPYAVLAAAMTVTGFLGTLAGTSVLGRLDERLFRKALNIMLIVLAFELVRRGLAGLIG
ncbi:sulfite exporter TauE/SafE family protein [Fulvimarina sp. 2208YS6-2-32]|uniref:Probable membrane transporter protein n=1 Tax=Fulvimarina uroteuthidis TaxID=3098149 RepID=A0ABU5HZ79_9HYPH|nr:sulfite exporter TauE/SafE family protein [Fulvimarina sp. 2208YS6-2-32]MDY8108435.1 sulfite exporter TauE/SafE family protein [Fulvimarina sp. 2208YS6-2-32]